MIRLNNEGTLEAQETIDQIKDKIQLYEEQIALKNQRKAYNPFDLIEGRILTPNMSRQDQYNKFMEEAKKAILQKLSTDDEMSDLSNNQESNSLFEDSQDPNDLEISDDKMAEFYEKLLPKKLNDGISTDDSGDSEPSNKQDTRAKSKDKKNKGKNSKKKY